MSRRRASKPPGSAASPRRGRWRDGARGAAAGAILGLLTAVAAMELGLSALPFARNEAVMAAGAGLGALLGLTRIRGLLWLAAGAVSILVLVVGYTPLIVSPVHRLARS